MGHNVFCLFVGFGLDSALFGLFVPDHLTAALFIFAGGAGLAAILAVATFRDEVMAPIST